MTQSVPYANVVVFRKDKDHVICQIFGKKGHIAIACHNRHNETLYPTPAESKARLASYAKRIPAQADINATWFSDSGATDHITN